MMQSTWSFFTRCADLDERRRARLGRAVERADDRRLDHRELELGFVVRRPCGSGAGRQRTAPGSGGVVARRGRWRRQRCAARDHGAGPALRIRSFSPSRSSSNSARSCCLHQLQDPFDVVEFQSASEMPACRRLSRASARPHPVVGHQHVVFDPDAAESLDIRARLDREHHARARAGSRPGPVAGRPIRGSSCTSSPRPWPVPWPNASPSPCRTSTSRAAASTALAQDPGRTAAIAAWCASATALGQPAPCRCRGPQLDRPRQIHAVSVVDTPEVQHHPILRGQAARAGPGVRKGAVGPGRRRSYRTPDARTRPSRSSAVDVGARPRFRCGPPAPEAGTRAATPASRRPASRSVAISLVVLHRAGPLDQPFGADQHRAHLPAVHVHRAGGRELDRQAVEPGHRQPLPLDANPLRAARLERARQSSRPG